MMGARPDSTSSAAMSYFVTNTDRAAAAQQVIRQAMALDATTERVAIVDALSNLMHLSRQRGFSFDDLLAQARIQHDIEQMEDPEGPGVMHKEEPSDAGH